MHLYAHELLGFVLTRVDSANPDTNPDAVIRISTCKRGFRGREGFEENERENEPIVLRKQLNKENND